MQSPKPKILTPKLYGRRKGRVLGLDLRQAVDQGLSRFGIARDVMAKAAEKSLHPKDFFTKPASEYWLEIGFGGGDFLAGQAGAHPDIGLIGCEAFENGVAKVAQKLIGRKIENARIYPDDVRHLLPKLQDACLNRVFLLFPDPWPKKRHAKRRFVSQENLAAMSRVMKPGAEFWIATDDPTYQEWVPVQMAAQSWFQAKNPPAEGFWHLTPPVPWFETGYQKKAKRAGRTPKFIVFSKI